MDNTLQVFVGLALHPLRHQPVRCVLAAHDATDAARLTGLPVEHILAHWTAPPNVLEDRIAHQHPRVPCYGAGPHPASLALSFTPLPRDPDAAPAAAVLPPRARLQNVANVLLNHTTVVRPHNGRGRCATYAANVDAIAQTGRQLAELVLAYLEGELAPVPAATAERPF